MASTNSTVFGTLYAASRLLAYASTSSTVGGDDGSAGSIDRVHPPTPLGVLQPDHDDVGDPGVVDERALDLGREDVGATGDDHVDTPVDDVEVALGLEPAEVAAGGEAVDRRAAAAVRRRGSWNIPLLGERM